MRSGICEIWRGLDRSPQRGRRSGGRRWVGGANQSWIFPSNSSFVVFPWRRGGLELVVGLKLYLQFGDLGLDLRRENEIRPCVVFSSGLFFFWVGSFRGVRLRGFRVGWTCGGELGGVEEIDSAGESPIEVVGFG